MRVDNKWRKPALTYAIKRVIDIYGFGEFGGYELKASAATLKASGIVDIDDLRVGIYRLRAASIATLSARSVGPHADSVTAPVCQSEWMCWLRCRARCAM